MIDDAPLTARSGRAQMDERPGNLGGCTGANEEQMQELHDSSASSKPPSTTRPFVFVLGDALERLPVHAMPPTERAVLTWIATHANRDGANAYPSIKRLSRLTGFGTSTIVKAIEELVKRRWVSRKVRIGPDGGTTSNLYTVDLDGVPWDEEQARKRYRKPPPSPSRNRASERAFPSDGNPPSRAAEAPFPPDGSPFSAGRHGTSHEPPMNLPFEQPTNSPALSRGHTRAEDDNEELGGRPCQRLSSHIESRTERSSGFLVSLPISEKTSLTTTKMIGRVAGGATVGDVHAVQSALACANPASIVMDREPSTSKPSIMETSPKDATATTAGNSPTFPKSCPVSIATTMVPVEPVEEPGEAARVPVRSAEAGKSAHAALVLFDQNEELGGRPWTSTSKPETEEPGCSMGSLSSAEPAMAPRSARSAAEPGAFVDAPSATAGPIVKNALTVKGTERALIACQSTVVARSAVVLKTENREAISWPYPTLRLKSATTETSCPATADPTVSADAARDTGIFSIGRQPQAHEKKLGLAPTAGAAASVPTAEQPSLFDPVPEKPAKKARKQPPRLLTVEELSPEERKIHDAIKADPSLDPIVPCAPQTARDLLLAAPEVNVALQVARAGAWLRANPQRRKSRGGAFLLNWVSRQEPDAEYVRQREEERQRAEREANRRKAPPLPPLKFATDGGIFKGKEPAEIFAMLEKKLCNTLPRETEPAK